MTGKESVMVIVVNNIHVTVAVNKPEEKNGLLNGIKEVLTDIATAALTLTVATAMATILVWVLHTLFRPKRMFFARLFEFKYYK